MAGKDLPGTDRALLTVSYPYPLGRIKPRDFDPKNYNPRQEAGWQAINTAYYAWTHGLVNTLLPTPGESVDMVKWPQNLWLWLYQRLIRAPA